MSRPSISFAPGISILLILAMCLLAGCSVLADSNSGTANITSVTITPNTISESSTGMTDQFFTVTLNTEGFTEDIEGAEIHIQQNNRRAEPQSQDIQGNTVVLEQIALSWFQGLGPGEYSISARVYSADEIESVELLDVATVTVTP